MVRYEENRSVGRNEEGRRLCVDRNEGGGGRVCVIRNEEGGKTVCG